jgi:hypothetical protein
MLWKYTTLRTQNVAMTSLLQARKVEYFLLKRAQFEMRIK